MGAVQAAVSQWIMSVDFSKIIESKRRTRRELQALPFEEKLRILERLREDLIIGLANQRSTTGKRATKTPPDQKPFGSESHR